MAPDAAEALGITSSRLKALGLIDRIVPEPLGGAHREPQVAAQSLKRALLEAVKQLQEKKPKQLVEERLERLMGYGKFKEAAPR
jgi:acetyl-CoA carboxylase carboxyl transferase subunit alpha